MASRTEFYRAKAQQAERRAARAFSTRLRMEFQDLGWEWWDLVRYLERLSEMRRKSKRATPLGKLRRENQTQQTSPQRRQ
jgi:hypothetical protein